jgi:uncharacterized protein
MKRIRDLDVASLLARVTAFSVRRALTVVTIVAVLALLGLLMALRLDPNGSPSTLADSGASASKATEELHDKFGDEPIVVLVRGKLTGMLLTQDVGQLLGLEGCISGNAPPRAKAPAPVCAEFAKRKPIEVVYGPGTFINDAATRILDQLGLDQRSRAVQARRAARAAQRRARQLGLSPAKQRRAAQQAIDAVQQGFAQDALRLSLQYGLNSVPALNNPEFVLQLVFAPAIGAEVPKPRFSYVFPDKEAALIEARPRPGLSQGEREHTVAMVREAVQSKAFKLKYGRYVVAGAPVVAAGIESGLSGTAWMLLIVAAIVIAAILGALFRSPRRLFPLLIGLVTAAIAFGVLSTVGGTLTPGAVAALPVLLGLATALGIQFQRGGGGPALVTAGAVMVAGLLVLLLAPVPVLRSFGLLVGLGGLLAGLVLMTFGAAILGAEPGVSVQLRERLAFLLGRVPVKLHTLFRRGLSPEGVSRLRALAVRHLPSPPAGRSARRAGLFFREKWGGALDVAVGRPRRVLWIAFSVAVLGWLAAGSLSVVSDFERAAPAGSRAVSDQRTLERDTGSSGQVSVLVHGDDLADPRAIAWMSAYQRRILARHGYSDRRPCREAQLCPGLSITNLFTSGPPRTRSQAEAVFRSLPRYFSQNVITKDRRTANIAFGVGRMSSGDRKKVIDDMRAQLDPPPGVTAELAGLPVVAATTHSTLETSQWSLALGALIAIFLVLLIAYRSAEQALVPLTPVAIAPFWAAPVLLLTKVPLNPLSVGLWAVVMAITAYFSVMLSALYRTERGAEPDRRAAVEATYRRARPALLAAIAAAAVGLAVLTLSGVTMLHDFGLAAFVDLAVALAGTALVLPAALVTAEEGMGFPRTRAEASAAAKSAAGRARVGLGAAARGLRAAPGHVRRAAPAARRRLRASAPFRK